MNQDSPINPKVIDNYGSWMLAPSRFRCHQSAYSFVLDGSALVTFPHFLEIGHCHVEDVGERNGKGKSRRP